MAKLFEENYIGNLKLKNRIVMSAMDLGFTNDGTINDKFIAFYEERARGGVGFIVIGGCFPEYRGRVWKSIIALDTD
ncbi:MAG: oxidoreductase, partial [Candidatus Anammoxibacter sp.]